jgi:hypothetical protein
MKRLILLAVFMLILCSAGVLAESKLQISKVEITSGDNTLLSTSSASGNFDAEAGDDLKVKVRLENRFSESTHTDINDITVKATMEGLGDTDQETALSVRADGERTVTLRFEIPDDASSYDSYYLTITASGTDENGSLQEDEASYDVEITGGDEGELDITDLNMDDVQCDEDGTLDIKVENNGNGDEQDVQLTARISGIGTVWEEEFDVDADDTYSKSKRLDLTGLSEGTHTVTLMLEYGDNEEVEEETDFRVEGCGSGRESYDYEFDEYYTTETPRKEVVTEPYRNPNRDLSFLYKPAVQPVVLEMPPAAPMLKMQPATQKESGFSMFVLALANIAILIFILLLVMSIYNR